MKRLKIFKNNVLMVIFLTKYYKGMQKLTYEYLHTAYSQQYDFLYTKRYSFKMHLKGYLSSCHSYIRHTSISRKYKRLLIFIKPYILKS